MVGLLVVSVNVSNDQESPPCQFLVFLLVLAINFLLRLKFKEGFKIVITSVDFSGF